MAEIAEGPEGIRLDARTLLDRAAVAYDAPGSRLPELARQQGWRSFGDGAGWMGQALLEVRGAAASSSSRCGDALGIAKYGLCAAAGALPIAALGPVAIPLAVLAFYAVEAQMVFLFPLALDGAAHPFVASRALTRRAGGTVPVMAMVLPIAWEMLSGGLRGRGFVRSWALGALAVVLAYEDVRRATSAEAAHASG